MVLKKLMILKKSLGAEKWLILKFIFNIVELLD